MATTVVHVHVPFLHQAGAGMHHEDGMATMQQCHLSSLLRSSIKPLSSMIEVWSCTSSGYSTWPCGPLSLTWTKLLLFPHAELFSYTVLKTSFFLLIIPNLHIKQHSLDTKLVIMQLLATVINGKSHVIVMFSPLFSLATVSGSVNLL